MNESSQSDIDSIISRLKGRDTVLIDELNEMLGTISPELLDSLFEELDCTGIKVLFEEEKTAIEDDFDADATVSIDELRELEYSPIPDSITILKKQSSPYQKASISIDVILAAQSGNKEAIQKVLESHLHIALKWSKLMKDRGLLRADLLQEGTIAILETLQRYNTKKSISFRSAVEWKIKNKMLQAIARKRRFIRLPSSIQDELRDVFRAESKLQQRLGRKPTDDEWAQEANTTPRRLRELLLLAPSPLSIEQPTRPDQSGIGEFLRTIGETTFEISDDNEILQSLNRALESLEETEKRVIELRFGLDNSSIHSIERTSKVLGISQAMVKKLEASGLSKLHSLLSNLLDDL